MRRMLLLFLYSAAALVTLGSLGRAGIFLLNGEWLGAAYSVSMGMVAWWFVSGVGLRMGVSPRDFALALGELFGFVDRVADSERSEDATI